MLKNSARDLFLETEHKDVKVKFEKDVVVFTSLQEEVTVPLSNITFIKKEIAKKTIEEIAKKK